ncbi:DUF7310 family coiled-coil domain-containing protein [Salinibaculum rarum]|uniref:DUF7310 family coiled-coil domain-containing protein n=1 Tax=Salinibaculum rarum TaxID=3058903 RepID=UPI0026600CCA|nr:hypothetical protein [Salinibaculum sp. KK48]
MDETLEDRLAALERAIADGEHDFEALATDGAVADRVQTVESDLETLTDRVAELEAATQALRGYVGNVRSVNEETRERADLALETAEQARAEAADSDSETAHGSPTKPSTDRSTNRPTDQPTDRQKEKSTDNPTTRATDRQRGRPNDQKSSNDTESEPTLELTADRTATDEPRHSQSGDRCPVCEETTARSLRDRQSDDGHSEPSDRLQGLTDGGRVQTDESSADSPGLLAGIRALL